MYLFLFLTLYMFRAHRAHHQERQIVSTQPLVAVGGRVVCRLGVHSQPAPLVERNLCVTLVIYQESLISCQVFTFLQVPLSCPF